MRAPRAALDDDEVPRRPLRAPASPALLAAALLAAAAVLAGAGPAGASASGLRVVASVTGAAGGVTAMALSTSGGHGFVVDGSDAVSLIDTATNAVVGATASPQGWLGSPTDVVAAPGDAGAYVVTDGGWISLVHGDGSVENVSALPGTGFGALASVPNGPSIVVVPTAVSPSAIYRVNVGVGSISPIPLAPATPSTLGHVVVGTGNGSDNRVFLAGTAGAVGVLYVFDGPFALGGPAQSITLPGSSSGFDVALSPDGTQAAVTSPADGLVFLVDVDPTSPTSGTVTATVSGQPATRVAYAPDGATLYAVGGNTVSVIDPAAGTVETSFPIDETSAAAIAVSPSGARLWVADAHVPGGIAMLADPAVGAPSATATVGTSFSAALTSSGFDLPVTYAVTPGLPVGLSLDPVSGVVSGTPGAGMAATAYTVTATSSDGASASAVWTLAVDTAAVPPSAGGTGASGTGASVTGGASDRLAASAGAPSWPALGGGLLLLGVGGALMSFGRALRTDARRDRRA